MKIRTKWVILQLLSLLSFVTIFPALFSAVPLVLFRLEAPRSFFYFFIFLANLFLTLYFLIVNPPGISLVVLYLSICFWGALAAELLLKYFSNEREPQEKINFWRSYLGIGSIPLLIFIGLLPVMLGHPSEWYNNLKVWSEAHVLHAPATLEILAELKKNTGPEAEQAAKLLENPDLFTKQLIFLIPSYGIVAYYVLAFFTLFFTSRMSHLTSANIKSSWVKTVMENYRNPDWAIISVILILAWYLFYQSLPLNPFWKENGELLGSSLINVIGVFFFFQGFMVCLQFFDHWGLKGFFRTIVLFFIFVLALRAIILLGLIDMWLDFRKRYIKTVNNL